jgi:hypothetical protein
MRRLRGVEKMCVSRKIKKQDLVLIPAPVHAELLLSRDRGFYKTYFKDLKVVQ